MPTRESFIVCACSECITPGSDGILRQQGVKWPSKSYAGHANRIMQQRCSQMRLVAEAAASNDPSSITPDHEFSEAAEQLSASLFSLTLADEGPQQGSRFNKLWNGRTEVQMESNGNIPVPDVPAISYIAEGVSRLVQSNYDATSAVALQPVGAEDRNNSSVSPLSAAISVPAATSQFQSITMLSRDFSTLTINNEGEKRENNHRTTTALQVLDAIEKRIVACQNRVTEIASIVVLCELEIEFGELSSAFEKVRRRTPGIDRRKAAIIVRLAELSDRIMEKRGVMPEPTDIPVSYSSGGTIYHASDFTNSI
jgi:hypothetical protein